MSKNVLIDSELEQIAKRDGKKRKKLTQTTCEAKIRQSANCGICGSSNVVIEYFAYCTKCGKETELFLDTDRPLYFNTPKTDCNCKETRVFRRRNIIFKAHVKVISIYNCVDCKAYKAPLCPNCKKALWIRFDKGNIKKHCIGLWSGCNFRENF